VTLVVGLPPDGRGEPLTLAAMLARSSGEDVVLATVTARGFPDPRADREYREWVGEQVRATQDDAVAALRAAGVDPRPVHLEAPSVPAGLAATVQQERGSLLVLGPARDAPAGRFTAGSVTDGLLHSSPVPLALAPCDCPSAERVTRLSCTWAGTDRSREALAWARRAAGAWGVPLRLVTFAPERAPMLPSETGLGIEGEVNAQWAEQAQAELDRVADGGETLVARGRGWAGAVAAGGWAPGDVLVVGSSRLGPLARVFLGSTATKIVRHAPVPVVLVPRGAGG
jgi:nucleotide-binding universal stress UspA family protein